ncbi:MAG: hypothetical protein AAF493_25445, partial [Pseudomonadota bacterium]
KEEFHDPYKPMEMPKEPKYDKKDPKKRLHQQVRYMKLMEDYKDHNKRLQERTKKKDHYYRDLTPKKKPKPPPKKRIVKLSQEQGYTPGYFVVKLAGHKRTPTWPEKDIVRATSKEFVDYVKHSMAGKGYIDVPVGAVRKTTLHNFPRLIDKSAPEVYYRQGDKDLCAYKSLASVMHHIGFEREAKKLSNLAENEHVSVANNIQSLHQAAVGLLPSYLSPRKVKKGMDFAKDIEV